MQTLTDQEADSIKRRLFETSQDLILVTNAYGEVIHASPSSFAIIGYTPQEIIGRSGVDLIVPEDIELTRNEMREARRSCTTRYFNCRYVHKDGHAVPQAWIGMWSEPDHHYFFIGRDMTERDRAEAQLRQAQKMEAVGQLTGGVAHDFNNILMVILANVDALCEDESAAAPLRKRLERIREATHRATDLTRRLLAFSRKQPLQPRQSNLNDLVASTEKLLRRTLGERIEIDAKLAKDLAIANIDRAQLESALVNLCVNARDAMPNGGRLLIETRNVMLDEQYAVSEGHVVPGRYVLLAVTDTGSGIPPEILTRVFEPFFTTKDVGKGTGLGLSMVYGFIKQSNGHIKIYSELGHGTCVKIYLPAGEGHHEPVEIGPVATMDRGKERILVAEDNAQVRESVVEQLRSLGYDVTEAVDGASALVRFSENLWPYDLLLTDVIMPGPLNGKALADEVARRWPEVRIVFMSGYTEDAIIHQGRLDPGVRLLPKPFRKAELARAVREALDTANINSAGGPAGIRYPTP